MIDAKLLRCIYSSHSSLWRDPSVLLTHAAVVLITTGSAQHYISHSMKMNAGLASATQLSSVITIHLIGHTYALAHSSEHDVDFLQRHASKLTAIYSKHG